MRQTLLTSLAPRLRELEKGGYARAYVGPNGKSYPTSVHLLIAEMLKSLEISFREEVPISRGSRLVADFAVGDTLVFVERNLGRRDRNAVARLGKKCIVVSREAERSDSLDPGIRVLELSSDSKKRLQTIFLDDPSFNFDYAHILPHTEKCSVMHGHTSSVLVEVVGSQIDGMVVDFGVAKDIIREAVRSLDHKLFINSKYVRDEDSTHVRLGFNTVHGDFALRVPKKTTVLLTGEATVENLAQEILSRITLRMPENVTSVGVYVYEGLNKGTHLLAQIHRTEAEKSRRPR